MCRTVGSQTVSEPGQPSAFQVKGPPATAPGARRSWTTEEIGLVPTCVPQTIAWDQGAARLTFSLAPVLLAAIVRMVPSGVTGALVWVPCPAQTASPTLAVHPVLMVQAPAASLSAECVTIVPDLPAHDPLLHHMALVLQAALEGEGGAGQLSAAVLADALAVHFLRRYAASRPVLPAATGGLPPYKLRRTIAYIQDHLEHALSLVELAAVAHMSPHHFAHLFKQATGRTPHQYVTTCRMEQAKQLLAETDLPLSDIALQVGCADHSHFTALFRQHVGTTPKVYRTGRRGSAGSIPIRLPQGGDQEIGVGVC
ncbi:MAG TPA: AraC family transcriptional regulator [Candidatus Tectomicrobia bacterium]